MIKNNMKTVSILFLLLIYSMVSIAQITTVKQALDAIPYSELPYKNSKGILFPVLGEFPVANTGISDKLYDDVQYTRFINASSSVDLSPSLYLKIDILNNNILGAVTFGGASDYEVDRLFISDKMGNIKSSLDVSVSFAGISVKQYQLTKDYKLIISQLVFSSPILFSRLMTFNGLFKAYRLDTIYSIVNGEFKKEKEIKYSEKAYSKQQMMDKNTWEL